MARVYHDAVSRFQQHTITSLPKNRNDCSRVYFMVGSMYE
jgi:hypothetical protein